MAERLDLEEMRNIIFSLDLESREIQTLSEGARYIIERTKQLGKFGLLIGHLIQSRSDVDWLSVYSVERNQSQVGNWNIIFSMIENNKAEIIEVRQHIVNLKNEINIDDIKDIVMGRRELRVRPIREDVQINRLLFMGSIAVNIIGFLVLGVILNG